MTTTDRVRSARNPQEAMLAVAEALDELLARATSPDPAPDPWGSWDTPNAGPPETMVEAFKAQGVEQDKRLIAAVREQLQTETDPDTLQALQAKLRLLEDPGAVVAPAPQGARVQSLDDGREIVVNIPAPDEMRMSARDRFVKAAGLYQFLTQPVLTEAEFNAAYVRGGPMWLYLGDRDAVMSMPDQIRHFLVADIEQDSPLEAQEIARDILKDAAPGTPDSNLARTYQ